MGKLYCVREQSVQFVVRYFYAVEPQCMRPLTLHSNCPLYLWLHNSVLSLMSPEIVVSIKMNYVQCSM
jgi:hypothetical protein